MCIIRHLPPLSALKAFEAAGRHLNLTLAADELNVTYSAVSKQVKALEQHVGVPLISRMGRGIVLTTEGSKLIGRLTKAFDELDGAVLSIDSRSFDGTVVINCMPALAGNWLIPKLPKFRNQYPDINLIVYSAPQGTTQINESADVHIIYGRPEWPDKKVTLLKQLEIFPVCSPALSNNSTLNNITDLINITLIDNPEESHWKDFLLSHGLDENSLRRRLRFQDFSHCLSAARSGHGVAMGDDLTAMSDLLKGTLIKPFRETIKRQSLAYYLITNSIENLSASTEAFCDWLISEIKKF